MCTKLNSNGVWIMAVHASSLLWSVPFSDRKWPCFGHRFPVCCRCWAWYCVVWNETTDAMVDVSPRCSASRQVSASPQCLGLHGFCIQTFLTRSLPRCGHNRERYLVQAWLQDSFIFHSNSKCLSLPYIFLMIIIVIITFSFGLMTSFCDLLHGMH